MNGPRLTFTLKFFTSLYIIMFVYLGCTFGTSLGSFLDSDSSNDTSDTNNSGIPGYIDTSQPFEIRHDLTGASGWFGGDNANPRNVGNGQSVFFSSNAYISSFAINLGGEFDYTSGPAGHGHAVTLILEIRDTSGNILQTIYTNLDAAFTGGWVFWTAIYHYVPAGTTRIFTCYLQGGFDTNQVTSSIIAESPGTYADGERYSKSDTTSDLSPWSGWGTSTWDLNFIVNGYIQ